MLEFNPVEALTDLAQEEKCLKDARHALMVRIGLAKKKERQTQGPSMNLLADSMGFSGAYVSDLERGRRSWSPRILTQYDEALRKCGTTRYKGAV